MTPQQTPVGPDDGLIERQKTLLGEALLAEQKAENAFAPEGQNLNRRAIHASVKAAWRAYDDSTDQIASALTQARARIREVEGERDGALDRVEELERDADIVS